MQRGLTSRQKQKIIAFSAYSSYQKLMFLASVFSFDKGSDVDDLVAKLKKDILEISARISYEILYQIWNESPEIENDTKMIFENLKISKNGNARKIKYIDSIEEARIISYLITSAYNDLGGRLVPDIVKADESRISKAVIEQSKNIIINLLTPLFKKFPELKMESDKIYNLFGVFPL
ncbi:hypothetical protein [Nitratifractor salsuginis]|uniref:Uncharacterized protein n=1 Tax=Nitratifractor salsuginis (strain DSM 16511 / JCM 12458 / E9I37-1) TaxID=749222 RepID=E6WZV4_NITSE|nr:hypothetical protein [Nitratifractor salsuginis]ADV45612.1 hypothetical protein Nitsa_0341 [Nitratifractor salsuginis DSM 16511]